MFAMNAISGMSLVHRFLLVGFCVLVAAMVFIGTWVGTQIQSGIMNGMGVMTDLYLDGAISPHLQSLVNGRPLDAADVPVSTRTTSELSKAMRMASSSDNFVCSSSG